MNFYVYILHSRSTEKFYIGQTVNIVDRIKRHNARRVPATKFGTPWEIIYTETLETRQQAVQREQFLKSPQGWLTLKTIKEQFVNRNVAQPG